MGKIRDRRKKRINRTTKYFIKAVIKDLYRLKTATDIAKEYRVSKQYVLQVAAKLRAEGFKIPSNPKANGLVRKIFNQRGYRLNRIIEAIKKFHRPEFEKYIEFDVAAKLYVLPTSSKKPKTSMDFYNLRPMTLYFTAAETLQLLDLLQTHMNVKLGQFSKAL